MLVFATASFQPWAKSYRGTIAGAVPDPAGAIVALTKIAPRGFSETATATADAPLRKSESAGQRQTGARDRIDRPSSTPGEAIPAQLLVIRAIRISVSAE
jgi:hypothetical protein